MSLSSPTLTNPAEHFFEWKGGEGKLTFYNKEKKENITVPVPFSFIVLDQLHTVTGYDKQAQSGFWSNEVKSLRDDLTVRTKAGVKYVGTYKNDQGIVQMPKGAGYTKSVYIAHKNKSGEYIMGNIKMSGSALSAWIEFTKQHSADTGKITMKKGDKQTSPVGDFYPPSFTWEKWTDDEYQSAIVLDKLLQQYLSQYLTAPKYDDNAEPVNDWDEETKATPEQLAEFEKLKASKTQVKAEDYPEDLPPAPEDTFNDESFDPSEIPF